MKGHKGAKAKMKGRKRKNDLQPAPRRPPLWCGWVVIENKRISIENQCRNVPQLKNVGLRFPRLVNTALPYLQDQEIATLHFPVTGRRAVASRSI